MFILAYIILLILAIILLTFKMRTKRGIVSTVFYITFVVYYIVVPLILQLIFYIAKGLTNSSAYLDIIQNSTTEEQTAAYIMTAGTLIVFYAFLNIRFKLSDKPINKNNESVYDEKALEKSVYTMGKIFLLIGGASLCMLFLELGGISSALALGSTIRGYRIDNAQYLSSLGAICKTLSVFVTGSFFCFYVSSKEHKRHLFYVTTSFILSVLYLVFESGRAAFLVFFGCLAFAFLKEHGKKVSWIVVVAFLGIFFTSSSLEVVLGNLALGRPLFSNLNYRMVDNVFATASDLAYPYANLLGVSKMVAMYGFRYCTDYITWIFTLLPERLFMSVGISIPSITLVTTSVSKYYLDAGLTLGGTPVDFISYGYFQGSIIGIVVNCLVYTRILRWIDLTFDKISNQYTILKFRMCFFAYSLITSNDLSTVIPSNLFLLIIVIVINRTTKKRRIKIENEK